MSTSKHTDTQQIRTEGLPVLSQSCTVRSAHLSHVNGRYHALVPRHGNISTYRSQKIGDRGEKGYLSVQEVGTASGNVQYRTSNFSGAAMLRPCYH